ncbi:GntR family transcriptional regulator [Limosilactobacillus ingluviei]|uniref:GntR family transcriptional regulator n=1 Tax=Limosilactobacillus ingluviei TaxID=148604 RepID=UPI0024BA26FF|nr:GntR family transcriptional regulator [Limosilactobacillus ingluviei]
MAEIKYEIVKNDLKAIIESGKYQPGDKLPTESDLMDKYQVSRYTIRRAVGELQNAHYIYRIQGGGMYVDDWQRNKNKPVINNKMIGVVTTHLADYIFPSIISGIDRTISAQGYSMIVSNTHNNRQKEQQSLQQMLDNQVAGLIIEPTQSALPEPNIELYKKIEEAKIPTLFINAHYSQIQAPHLEVDDIVAEEKVVNYLIEQGHQRILGIFQVDDMQGTKRLRGFMNAYMQHPEISYMAQTVMYQSDQDMTKIFQRVSEIMDHKERPTAIVCYNDELAIQIVDVIRAMGLQVPENVSIVGFDDYVLGRFIDPSLSTIAHPKEKMGIDAGNMIMRLINGEKVESIEYTLPIKLRDSVQSLKGE